MYLQEFPLQFVLPACSYFSFLQFFCRLILLCLEKNMGYGFLLCLRYLRRIVKYIVGLAKRQLDKIGTWRTYKYILQNLSDEEKVYLKRFFDKGQTAIVFSMEDPVAQKLKTFKVISQPSGTSMAPLGMSLGFIQPWVFEVLRKHPDYLEVSKLKTQEVQENA